MKWPKEELKKIAEKNDLKVSPFREDGKTYGTPTWVWSVAVGGELYARAYSGKRSSWYRAAIREGAGRITAAGITREVKFEAAEGDINKAIDEAYREKYGRSKWLEPMLSRKVRGATVRISPKRSARKKNAKR